MEETGVENPSRMCLEYLGCDPAVSIVNAPSPFELNLSMATGVRLQAADRQREEHLFFCAAHILFFLEVSPLIIVGPGKERGSF